MHHLKSYVLRPGRMSNLQRRSYESFFPKWGIPFKKEQLPLHELFPDKEKVVLEIGFGMGMATADIAEKQSDTAFLCTEVFTPGIGKLLYEIERRRLDNIRIIQHDAYDVVTYMLPEMSIDGVHIFFPDPWPKRKHQKRRLVQKPFLDCIALRLKPGGYLYLVTDWKNYAESMITAVKGSSELKNPSHGFSEPLHWRPKTKFERKASEQNHSVYEIVAYRKGRQSTN